MKHSFRCDGLLIILLFLIFAFSLTSARFLHTKQGEKMVELDESIKNTGEGSLFQIENTDSVDELMGMEACGSGDEECLKRRVVAEAHLDYIYTQHHKP